MRTTVGLDALEPPEQGSAVTIGTFDGVHMGHRALIARTLERARADGLAAVAITWDRHPNQTLRPARVPALLTTPERKVELLSETDLDLLVVLPFDEELSRWPPERFAEDVLAQGLAARVVLVGQGWRFGHKARGDVDLLRSEGQRMGFDAKEVVLASIGGDAASSTRVREAIAMGDLEAARALLGRPFDIDGVVEHGDDRGRDLGFPTANVALDPAMALPPRGVYAGRALADDQWYAAAINVGVNPTFGGDPEKTPIRLEAYLLDFDADLYGKQIRVELWTRLRDERRFSSAEALIAQMHRDVAMTRDLISS